jgi:tRNA threonylcarbamoyladenosine biosynthesis protein TsaE
MEPLQERTYIESDMPDIATAILSTIATSDTGATVLALQGDLGAGKTTLTKALAQQLGVAETVVSPTFVIAKYYDTANGDFDPLFDTLVHMDAYRIESLDELGPLGWDALLQRPKTLVIVEWPEKINGALPDNHHHFVITHDGEQRIIKQLS